MGAVAIYIYGVAHLFNNIFDVFHGDIFIHTNQGGDSDWRFVGLFGGMEY